MIISSLTLFLVFVTFSPGSGTSLRMDIVDDGLTGLIHNEVKVSCVSNMTQEVFLIGVAKENQNPLVNLHQHSKLTFGDGMKRNFKAEGQISKTKKPDYLTLTITSPGLDDLGGYVCLLDYIDDEGNLAQARASADVTIDNLGILGLVKQMNTSVSMLTHKINDQEMKQKQLEKLNKQYEYQIIQQQKLINEQNHTLNDLQHQIQQDNTHFTHQVQHQNATFSDFRNQLEKRLENLQGKVMAYSSKVTSRVDNLEDRAEKQNTMMTTMNQRATYMSAFAAGYDHNRDKLETGKVLVFRKVHMKVGNGYDETSGIFTAPVDGYYAFHLYVFYEDSDHDDLGVNIVANGKAVAQAYVDDPKDTIQTSVSTVVELRAGQEVKPVVSHLLGETYQLNLGIRRSGFTGYLIKQF